MSDKETAPTIPRLALQIRNLAHLAWTDRKSAEYLFREIEKRAQKISEIAVECTAPAPQPCGKNMGNDLLVIPCDLPRDHKGPCERNVWPVNEASPPQLAIVPLDGRDSWTEEELANFGKMASRPQPPPTEHLIRAAATPQVTPTHTYSEIDLRRMRRYAEELRPYLNKECPDPPRGLLGSIVGMLERSIEGTSEQVREFKPYMEDHEYYDPPQAPPTPEEFPSRSQEKRIRTMRGDKKRLDPRASPTPDKSRDTGISLDGGKTIHSKFKND